MISDIVDPKQLHIWYDRLTNRLVALDKDISRALSEYDRTIHRERWQDVASDRETIVRYMEALETGQSMPGPWPPRFSSILSDLPFYEELIRATIGDSQSIEVNSLIQGYKAQVNNVVKSLGQKYDPDLYVHRAIETDLGAFFDTPATDSGRNCYLIVSPAGSGKTNLLASLASHYVDQHPALFVLSGSIQLSPDSGLLGVIQSELQLASPKLVFHSPADCLYSFAQLARIAGRDALIFVDAINEYDQPRQMDLALDRLLLNTRTLPIKFIITCRDFYWGLFKGSSWQDAVVNELPNEEITEEAPSIVEFSRFSQDEHGLALDLYLRYYRISGRPVGIAAEQCRHPLLLRFFCEAYSGQEIGEIEDIRLKQLFDQYWNKKIRSIARRMRTQGDGQHLDFLESQVADFLVSLAKYMLHQKRRSVLREDLAVVTGQLQPLGAPSSLYFRVRDEHIILEESERSAEFHKSFQVSFVYEEFMEYVMAKALIADWRVRKLGELQILEEVEQLTDSYGEFAQILGVMVYVALMLKEEDGIALWPLLIKRGEKWRRVVFEAIRKLPETQIDSGVYGFFLELLTGNDAVIKKQALETLMLRRLAYRAPVWLVEEMTRLAVDSPRAIRKPASHVLVKTPGQLACTLLIPYLGHSNKNTANSARIVLTRLGDQAVDPLIKAFQAENRDLRRNAVKALRALRSERSAGPLVSMLKDPDEEVRREATKALGAIWKIPDLITLGDMQAKTRARAAKGLVNSRDPRLIKPLMALFWDKEVTAWEEAVISLRQYGVSEATHALLEALSDSDVNVKRRAIDALGRIGDSSFTGPLKGFVNADDPATRLLAIGALLNLGDESCIAHLEELLQSTAHADRAEIMATLERYYQPSRAHMDARQFLLVALKMRWGNTEQRLQAFDLMTNLYDKLPNRATSHVLHMASQTGLKHDDQSVRVAAVEVIGLLNGPDAIASLQQSLDDDSEEVRAAAVDALAILDSPEKVGLLNKALKDPNSEIRKESLDALGHLGDIQAQPAILGVLQDIDLDVRRSAIRGLGLIWEARILVSLASELPGVRAEAVAEIESDAEKCIPEALRSTLEQQGMQLLPKQVAAFAVIGWPSIAMLAATLSHQDAAARAEAIEALGASNDERAIQSLSDLLEHEDEATRLAAVQALARLGDNGVMFLIAATKHQDANVRVAAINKLGASNDERAMQPLCDLLQHEDKTTRLAAIHALAQFGDQGVMFLIAALQHQDASVRVAVIKELGASNDVRAIQPLLNLLRHEDNATKDNAAKVHASLWLARLAEYFTGAPSRPKWVVPLIAAAEEQYEDDRVAVIEELDASNDERATQPLSNLLQDDDEATRLAALQALENLGACVWASRLSLYNTLTTAREELIEWLSIESQKYDWRARRAAIERLLTSEPANAVQRLRLLLSDSHPYVVWEATRALQRIGSREALLALGLVAPSKEDQS